jgi:hypothetical protein
VKAVVWHDVGAISVADVAARTQNAGPINFNAEDAIDGLDTLVDCSLSSDLDGRQLGGRRLCTSERATARAPRSATATRAPVKCQGSGVVALR